MAKQQTTTIPTANGVNAGMNKDFNDAAIPEGAYKSARNATSNTHKGSLGILSNEQSNLFCTKAPYTIIGAIHVTDEQWALFSTDNTSSEVGVFDEKLCQYTTVVNDDCLNFNKANLVIGQSKEGFDCTFDVYWADDRNPDRKLNLTNVPWVQDLVSGSADCLVFEDTDVLNCDAIRLDRLVTNPCITIEPSLNGGEMLNGSYQAFIAYTQNEQRITDYSLPSNIHSTFDHRNVNGSLNIELNALDTRYEEYELVILAFVNQKLVARSMGHYSTRTTVISIDRIDPATNVTVPLSDLMLDKPAYERSKAIFRNGEYLIRVAPVTKFDFNYQILANNISTNWVSVEYKKDYYRNNGTNLSLLRDEVYTYFIRWVYNTNDKTPSFHIPGRQSTPGELTTVTSPIDNNPELFFEGNNTGTVTQPNLSILQPDGGIITARGKMAYWQSTEEYPDNKPDVWGNLCGEKIRHHKAPSNEIDNHYNSVNGNVKVLGVEFSNIEYPKDNQGVLIPGIVGYEILRGSREGNKSIVAKGLINNMSGYNSPGTGELMFYPNYPFNDLREDPFLSTQYISGNNGNSALGESTQALGGARVSRSRMTFHSPDTQFKHPFLSSKEMHIYETNYANVEGQFTFPYKHPKFVLVSNLGFFMSLLVGFGMAVLRSQGSKKITMDSSAPGGAGGDFAGAAASQVTNAAHGANTIVREASKSLSDGMSVIGAIIGATGSNDPGVIANSIASGTASWFGVGGSSSIEQDLSGGTGGGTILRFAQGVPFFVSFWSEATEESLSLLKNYSKDREYVIATESHAHYLGNNFNHANTRLPINDASYTGGRLQEFSNYKINNLHRASCVSLKLGNDVPLIPTTYEMSGNTNNDGIDKSRFNIKDIYGSSELKTFEKFNKNADGENIIAASHYVGLKQRLRNQYGQIEGIHQITVGCMKPYSEKDITISGDKSEILFPGDTYIGRYTEKNPFMYFFDWLLDQPDGYEYNYRLKHMIQYPTYWMDTSDYQISDLLEGIFDMLFEKDDTDATGDIEIVEPELIDDINGASPGDSGYITTYSDASGGVTAGPGGSSVGPSQNNVGGILPSSFYNLDTGFLDSGALPVNTEEMTSSLFSFKLTVKDAYMYLFNSGVRDFYVESEINVEQRDWEEEPERRHYDPYLYMDYEAMFRSDIIKKGNFYKYDYSLSASRFYQAGTTWGSTHTRNYDPNVSESCYVRYDKRVIFSLPQHKDLRVDNWGSYLINNYKDFTSEVTVIKEMGNNGAMMLFDSESPVLINGSGTLSTQEGVEITIGSGGLFNQPIQHLVNTDSPYEYASCQNRLSAISTPAGFFWVSQNQGKVFSYTGQINEISNKGMKWWFNTFLPYSIVKDFPDFELLDNPVIGVGVQSVYDNSTGMLYISKRDYRYRPSKRGRGLTYTGGNLFQNDLGSVVQLGDERYFDNASWTVSYDTKTATWISFHDWHPNLSVSSKSNFLTIKNDSIWRHNLRTDSYCNFYNQNYPFEVEIPVTTGQSVSTLKSIDYFMEVFKWNDTSIDSYHSLDFNFDEAVVYNTEQISGKLKLNITPKNSPQLHSTYPRVNVATNNIDILYSKEENKYRFNQFWDITDDRGEFSTAERFMWTTEPNGYIKDITSNYVDYLKHQHQRKKFRHYQTTLLLRRNVSGDKNMQLKVVNTKQQYSPR